MSTHFAPASYLDLAVRDVLTGEAHQVDDTVAHAGLLLAACGAADESDRLVRRWRAARGVPADALAANPVRERAWAMLLAARARRPDWADELTPLDPDEAEHQHWKYLGRAAPTLPRELATSGAAARIVADIAELADRESGPDRLRGLAARAERLAARGSLAAATSALDEWARQASRTARPEIAMLAACRNLAPLLVDGLLAPRLGIESGWPEECAGELSAALHTRFTDGGARCDWPELIGRIMRTRADEARATATPPPAEAAELDAAEHRLGARLPADYRRFLFTSDGLPADVVFPRLLGAAELVRTGSGIAISATSTEFGESTAITLVPRSGEWRTVEWDSTLGLTEYASFRGLLEHHLYLLEHS